MIGWLIFFGMALAALVLLWRFGRVGGTARDLTLSALFLAAAGYAWQGNPNLASVPRQTQEKPGVVDPGDANLRRGLNASQFGGDNQWLDYSDALLRMNSPRLAVIAIKSGLKEHPRSADLWTALGNALVAQGEGLVSPAATFAYEHAAELDPAHPGPPFFYGLMVARSGNTKAAGEIWRGLLARAPDGAPWKADLERRLTEIGEAPIPKTDKPAE
ncbi:Cytochrome C biogenesis protein [Sphingomonas antarctica]|uniref:tetratricopeptide repeat protein n=1 Tax=Sphingomonas antarctica TaxID=2040274 RepID=UPI0039EBCF03